MEDTTLAKYRSLIGQEVQYTKSSFLKFSSSLYRGKLVDIKYFDRKGKLYAVIQRASNKVSGKSAQKATVDQVPVEDIFTPVKSTKNSDNRSKYDLPTDSRHKDAKTLPPSDFEDNALEVGIDKYTAVAVDSMKIGDEVVWLRDGKSTFMGKVTFTGQRFMGSGKRDIVAIVQFDQPTSKLPRYIPTVPLNRNIIKIDDLMLLSIWLETFSGHDNQGASIAEGDKQINNKTRSNYLPDVGQSSPLLSSASSSMESIVDDESLANGNTDANRKTQVNDNVPKIEVIGNCLAIQNGTEPEQVEEVKRGYWVVARTMGDAVILGEVRMTCTINGLGDTIYAGVKFQKHLGGGQGGIYIKHVNENTEGDRFCKQCKGAKSLFIDVDQIQNTEHHIFNLIASEDSSCSVDKVPVDVTAEANRSQDFESQPISPNHLEAEIEAIGIIGQKNQSHADALLFAMFAFDNIFDPCVEHGDDNDNWRNAIVNIIKFDIISPLRRKETVELGNVQKLLLTMAHYNPECAKGKYMDMEEFALLLLQQILNASPFLEYPGGYEDFIYQIFVTPEDIPEPEMTLPTLQSLLVQSFKLQEISLKVMPVPAFFVKLPVSDGKLCFPRLYPNPLITVESICESDDGGKWMTLQTVVCLKDNHFTCFMRMKKSSSETTADGGYIWYYYDSMPNDRIRLQKISDFECLYERAASQKSGYSTDRVADEAVSHDDKKGPQDKGDVWFELLLTTAYMCIYVPSSQISKTTE